ncbi:MAG: ActS/PrrB/RegB family redox-sensitive histidine kinase [Vannielia sp.]|uniref:sensor histidine kinase RegB n=1 Tax=Rhodobacterales TaxID=204455 RepID=UPI002094E1BC|nr:ActS/PrrB/RegB family redox-sensitive histidine kinase [Oceanicola sp. 502str15]MCO6384168.1 ActS/PrrB/RegB family redox-sensitive histidine kinase [Oceanicola sp. 502str15]
MPETGPSDLAFQHPRRANWIRLRTLIVLRWVAVAGQSIAVAIAHFLYGLQLEFGLCVLAIGMSVVANLVAMFIYPANKRLNETETMLMLVFDLAQLALLIFLTGGLHNPFALLLLTPVTIAATALGLNAVLTVGAVAIGLVTFVAFQYLPLRTVEGFVLRVPSIFLFGSWIAIVIGVSFLALYARKVTTEIAAMGDALLATQLALAREQKLTDLGGVVAAAAHELGTPLATIKLVSSEMADELQGEADRESLLDDSRLIGEQADRCREILRSMGRAGKDDLHMRSAPLQSVLEEAAEPHQDRGKVLHFDMQPGPGGEERQPQVQRSSEMIHGVRNLIQNAVDFAAGNVWIEARWTSERITVRVIDDGEGYPPQLIGRIGDPFVRRRRGSDEGSRRPQYEGMGLGLFIAKTLLERIGAALTFANGSDPFLAPDERPDRGGAIVEVTWPRALLVSEEGEARTALGLNRPIQA